jgi:hypothetical protein
MPEEMFGAPIFAPLPRRPPAVRPSERDKKVEGRNVEVVGRKLGIWTFGTRTTPLGPNC